jgi:class 3 adenylate cyclase
VTKADPATANVACVECGAELAPAPKFCPECGTPISPRGERESRRTVTLLFTDVSGSTAMGEQLDLEAFRGVMGQYFEVARAAIERHGGTVEKFVGDAVLAVFGVPDVHEDDALRAVRAARELNDAVAELGVGLSIRTGLNTGPVVAGTARAGGSFATGDAVNTAARLEQAAGDGEILLGASTYSLVRDAVEVEAVPAVAAKGKTEPVPAYRLVRVLDAPHGRRRRADADLVGRVTENRALDDAFNRMVDSGRSHLVTVLGPAGIGKSRLVTDFLTRVEGRAEVAYGRCVSYGQGITYWPLVQALRHALRLSGTESDEITRHALERALGDVGDRDQVVAGLLPLLGRTGVPAGNDQTVWSVRRLLEALVLRRPLVLSVDDLHWAEPSLLELLERVREELSDLPLLLLCQARPELLEEHPDWGSGAVNALAFGLEPLSPGEIQASVSGLLGGSAPDGLADSVASWSGGNPLFAEEIVAHLVESRVIEPGPDRRWRIMGDLGEAVVPPTVSALLAARLDLLPPVERDLLGRVSVVGLEFSAADAELLVEPLPGPGVTELLSALVRRDLVRRARTPTDESWAFKHILVRDAAYADLAKSTRAELHERYADSLAASDEVEGGAEHAGFVAHHLEQAARYRRELGTRGPDVEALVGRAVEALETASEQAWDRDLLVELVHHLERAIRLEPDSSVVRRRLLARLADHHLGAFLMDRFAEVLDAFAADLDETALERDHAFLQVMRHVHQMLTGGAVDPAEVARVAEELVASGRAWHDEGSVVRGLRVAALASAMRGLWQDAADIHRELARIGSAADAREARAWRSQALLLGDGTLREYRDLQVREAEVGWHSDLQDFRAQLADALVAAAERSAGAATSLAAAATRVEELAAAGAVAEPSVLLVDGYALVRDLDAAVVHADEVGAFLRDSGALGVASTYLLMRAMFMLERGDPPASVLPVVEEAATYTAPNDAASLAFLAACRAILAARDGDVDRAVELTQESLSVIDRTQQLWQRADLRRWLSEVPRTSGDTALERRLLTEAAQMYARKEISSYQAEIQARLAELGDTRGVAPG